MQGASTKTFLYTFVICLKIFPELEFLPVPPLKLDNGRLPLFYGCCPTYWQISSVSFCSLRFLHFAPKTLFSKLGDNKTGGDNVWCCIIENISEVITFAVVQTITSVSPWNDTRKHATSLISFFFPFFWWGGGKVERTWWMSMFLETNKVIPFDCWAMI